MPLRYIANTHIILVDILLRLQVPRGTWPALARFLKYQQDLVNAQDDEEKLLKLQMASEAYDALHIEETLERKTRIWPYDF